MRIRTELLTAITVARLQQMLPVVDLDPPYQREGGVWDEPTRSRLIDSMINGLDMPKLYFERPIEPRPGPGGAPYQYAVIDGKQRLEAVIGFLNGELRLGTDFLFFENEDVAATGRSFEELRLEHPELAQRFLFYELPIVSVKTDSGDLIEEMFQRLNSSSDLNAAERRNAISGPTNDSAVALSRHELLTSRSPIKNARYKYRELGAKFLAIEQQFATRGRVVDTKAETLLALFMATSTRGGPPSISSATMAGYQAAAERVLTTMADVFNDDDRLLASIGTVVVYYIVFRDATVYPSARTTLERFERLRRDAAAASDNDPIHDRPATRRLREYNVWVQSTNDGAALSGRARILRAFLEGDPADPLAVLDNLPAEDPASAQGA